MFHSFKIMASPTKYTAFRCPEDLLAKAKLRAESERRSLSNYLITLIEKDTDDVDLHPRKNAATRSRLKRL